MRGMFVHVEASRPIAPAACIAFCIAHALGSISIGRTHAERSGVRSASMWRRCSCAACVPDRTFFSSRGRARWHSLVSVPHTARPRMKGVRAPYVRGGLARSRSITARTHAGSLRPFAGAGPGDQVIGVPCCWPAGRRCASEVKTMEVCRRLIPCVPVHGPWARKYAAAPAGWGYLHKQGQSCRE